jgi:hypothetical protein
MAMILTIQALLALTIVASFGGNIYGFVVIHPPVSSRNHISHRHQAARQGDDAEQGAGDSLARTTSRRNLLQSIIVSATSVVLLVGGASMAAAAEKPNSREPTIYLTGKAPIVPGQKPRDKNDVSGTRKDPNFLRSLSDCKSQCENRAGPDGLAKSKEDCLSECQDICCTTYEQYVVLLSIT